MGVSECVEGELRGEGLGGGFLEKVPRTVSTGRQKAYLFFSELQPGPWHNAWHRVGIQ